MYEANLPEPSGGHAATCTMRVAGEAARLLLGPALASGPDHAPGPSSVVQQSTRLHGNGVDVAAQDWDALLSAVKYRLTLTAGGVASATERLSLKGEVRLQDTVLDCVIALDRLHLSLRHELERRQQLELDLFDAQSALAQARAELVGTQAGEKRARHLALHDDLTSLPNRGHFIERLASALAQAEPQRRPLAVMYIDLDGFKPVNDLHGHDIGDQLLRIIAARLNRTVRAEDMVSRLGGDEFACLLADVPDRETVSRLACKLFDAVAAPVKLGELELAVRPSIGIATCPGDGVDGAQLMKHADAAMYHAKRQRCGYAFFDQCPA
jgi:diguanylate cyclase (GGDEF)-like protein